jgi:hypothetical protein
MGAMAAKFPGVRPMLMNVTANYHHWRDLEALDKEHKEGGKGEGGKGERQQAP